MKKIYLALGIVLSVCSLSRSNAQPFLNASYTDVYYPNVANVSQYANLTNCYSFGNVLFSNSNVYDVYVHCFDGVSLPNTNWGFAWALRDLSGSGGWLTGYQSMPTPYTGAIMRNMDIGLVQQANGDVQIALAFWDPSVGHQIAFYSIDPTGASSVSLTGLSSLSTATAGNTQSRINLDCNSLNTFVLTWEENYKIYSAGGVASAGSIPTVNSSFTVILNDPAIMPDVALCNSNAGLNAHYTYLNLGNGSTGTQVEEAVINFNNVIAGSPIAPVIEDIAAPGDGMQYPRIDCPDNATDDDWSYTVMAEQPGGNHLIFASVRVNNLLPVHHSLNDGSMLAPGPMADMRTYKNDYPVVAFDRTPGYIHYSWSIMHPSLTASSLVWDRAYVGVILENNNNYIDDRYWVMEQNNASNSNILRGVALSGQNDNTPDLFSTVTYENSGEYISCKMVPWLNIGFKNGHTTGITTLHGAFKVSASPNPTSSIVTLNIEGGNPAGIYEVNMVDVAGKSILKYVGNLSQVNGALAYSSQKLLAGTYFISVKEGGTSNTQLLKVVKQ